MGNGLEGQFWQTGKPALEDCGTSWRPCHRGDQRHSWFVLCNERYVDVAKVPRETF